ncbi:MAG: AAA family ATPase [Pseudomonadota bacterium]
MRRGARAGRHAMQPARAEAGAPEPGSGGATAWPQPGAAQRAASLRSGASAQGVSLKGVSLKGVLADAPFPGAEASPEIRWAAELDALTAADDGPRPPGWRLTPRAVRSFLLGGALLGPDGAISIERKQHGAPGPVETAIAALAAGRPLLLLGPPGVGKSHLSALLAAAIAGDSRQVVQGAAGVEESALRYGWDYARLLAEGPGPQALTPSPVLRAMETGRIARIEELTRMSRAVQDALVGPLSERAMAIPELEEWRPAAPGFGLIATGNAADRGVVAPSAALMRRFAVVRLTPPASFEEEVALVRAAAAEQSLGRGLPRPPEAPIADAVALARALRAEAARRGGDVDGPGAAWDGARGPSPAELVDAVAAAWSEAIYLGDGEVSDEMRLARCASALGRALADGLESRESAPWDAAALGGADPVSRAFRDALGVG